MTVDELLTQALVLFMGRGKKQGLDYVSRSHAADTSYYFWLTHVRGVYEIERASLLEDGLEAEFYLRYYPDTEEEVLEDYSVEEQLLRFDEKFFNDNAVTTDEEEHEICPCCTVPVAGQEHGEHGEHGEHCCCGHHHEHEEELVHRKVGIPHLVKKFTMQKKIFLIGMLKISMQDSGAYITSVDTKERLVERCEEGISFMKDGEKIELIAPGGINRNVPGKSLCDRFMAFFNGGLLAAVK